MFGKKNEKTVIQFDNEKRRKMKFLQILFVVAAITVVILIFYLPGKFVMSKTESNRLNSVLFAVILGYAGLMRHYIKVLDKENAALVISSRGIVFNGTETGRGLGLIPWEDIEAVDRVTGDDGGRLRHAGAEAAKRGHLEGRNAVFEDRAEFGGEWYFIEGKL